jgi:hypothetical protein
VSSGNAYCKGLAIAGNIEYIGKLKGQEGLEKIQRYLNEKGYDIDVFHIEKDKWYPIEERIELLRALVELFGWDEEKIERMATESVESEIKIGFLLKYMASMEVILKSAAKIWGQHYTVGKMRLVSFDGNRAVLRLTDFDYDPLMCVYLKGYLRGLDVIFKEKLKSVRETVCTHRGGPYHEFVLEW